jgi:hypothetical protein
MNSCKIIEFKGVIRKILQNKELIQKDPIPRLRDFEIWEVRRRQHKNKKRCGGPDTFFFLSKFYYTNFNLLVWTTLASLYSESMQSFTGKIVRTGP